MADQEKKPRRKKRQGRPPAGVTNAKYHKFRAVLARWMVQGKLPSWLKDPEDWYKSKQAYDLLNAGSCKRAAELTDWCNQWLSTEGWKRLQANVRQVAYLQGKQGETGDKPQRERFRNLQLKYSVYSELKEYAIDHDLTLNDAVMQLLGKPQSSQGRAKWAKAEEDQAPDFDLKPDRHVWKCQKCGFRIESETDEILSNEVMGHKYMDCPGDWD